LAHLAQRNTRGALYLEEYVVLLISSLLFSVTCYVLLTNKELSLLDQTELLWLLGKVIIGVALLVVTVDASSIITAEFERETAESLFLSPVSLTDFVLLSKARRSIAGSLMWP